MSYPEVKLWRVGGPEVASGKPRFGGCGRITGYPEVETGIVSGVLSVSKKKEAA